jgi:hypothetical protein
MLGLLLPTSLGASSASIADSLNDEIAKLRKQIAKQQATISKQQVTIETLEGNNKSRSLKGHVATVAPPSQAGDLSKPKPPETPPWWGTFLLRKDNLEASDILFPGTLQQNDDAKPILTGPVITFRKLIILLPKHTLVGCLRICSILHQITTIPARQLTY